MNQLPYFGVNAVPHKYLTHNTKVLQKDECDNILYVKTPPELCKEYKVIQIDEIFSGRNIHQLEQSTSLPLDGLFKHNDNSIWYEFNFEKLNNKLGHHTYKMTILNDTTNHKVLLYFSYLLTGVPEEKLYKYTKGE